MKIINPSRKTTITNSAKKLDNLWGKTLGLLIKGQSNSLIFKTRLGIHTFFLKEPIDILVLDKNMMVVKVRSSLKPFRLFFWNPKYDLVVELPMGSIKASKTQVGDIISFKG